MVRSVERLRQVWGKVNIDEVTINAMFVLFFTFDDQKSATRKMKTAKQKASTEDMNQMKDLSQYFVYLKDAIEDTKTFGQNTRDT